MSVGSTRLRGQPRAALKNYADELGWTRRRAPDGAAFTGYYRASGLRYEGWVVEHDDKLLFYILRPPMNLLRETDFSGCFHARNDGWWLVSFKPDDRPADAASGIASIQKALRDAFRTRSDLRRERSL